MMPILSLLVTPELVIMIIADDASDEKFCVLMTWLTLCLRVDC